MPEKRAPAKPKPMTSTERSRLFRERRAQRDAEAAAQALTEAATARDATSLQRSPQPATMLGEVNAAVKAMKWLQPSDGALVFEARLYAMQIDRVLGDDPNATGKAASLGQLLTRILHELGGTPTVRLQHELRSLRAQLGANQPDGDNGNNETRANGTTGAKANAGEAVVTSIRRPAKRKR